MTQVWERLFIGSLQDAEELATANPWDITTVITLCSEDVWPRAHDIKYLHYAISDQRPISQSMFVIIIEGIGGNIRRGKVLINCGAGMSRSPIIVAAWMQVVGYKFIEECLSEIARLRPIVDPSPVLLASVKEQIG
jgi:protein-tyrosine phosphatase